MSNELLLQIVNRHEQEILRLQTQIDELKPRNLAQELFVRWVTASDEHAPNIPYLDEDMIPAEDGPFCKNKNGYFSPQKFEPDTKRYKCSTTYYTRLMRFCKQIAKGVSNG